MPQESILSQEYIITLALVFSLKITCFVLAYLIIRMGYALIASGVKGEFKFSTSVSICCFDSGGKWRST